MSTVWIVTSHTNPMVCYKPCSIHKQVYAQRGKHNLTHTASLSLVINYIRRNAHTHRGRDFQKRCCRCDSLALKYRHIFKNGQQKNISAKRLPKTGQKKPNGQPKNKKNNQPTWNAAKFQKDWPQNGQSGNPGYYLDAETSSVSSVFIARGYLWSNAQNRHPFHQLPLRAYHVILLKQPWHDLFKRKETHSLCSLYILNLPVCPRQGPFQHPSTQKTLLRTIFLHQTNLFDACRVHLNTKFIKILSIQVTDVTIFTQTKILSQAWKIFLPGPYQSTAFCMQTKLWHLRGHRCWLCCVPAGITLLYCVN